MPAKSDHEIYEASAGTGKTHQVVQKVLGLLNDGKKLEEILVVTFTEKAAGELVDRLRSEIAKTRKQDDYENAQVFTIHAFCLNVLRQFPYIHSAGGHARLVSDRDVLRLCLRDIERRRWPEEYRSALSALLAVSNFGDDWEEQVLNLAGAYRPACKHRLLPDGAAPIAELEALAEEFIKARATIAAQAGPLESTVTAHPLYELYGRAGDEGRRDTYLSPVLLWSADLQADANPIASFVALAHCVEDSSKKFGILTHGMKAKIKKASATERTELTEAMNTFERLADSLNALRERLPDVRHALAVATVRGLLERAREYKAARGLQSFEDFLTLVDAALDKSNPRAPALLAALRERYKAAIVDEFQDTDVLQWRIFRRIFMDGAGEHQLIVVGDPKQAIYSFRNADLETYLEARDAIGKPISLEKCYRATPELLEGLNAIFEVPGFFGSGGRIAYRQVEAPNADNIPALMKPDNSGRTAVTAVRIPDDRTGAKARPVMAGFIGAEIERLLNGGAPLLKWRHKGVDLTLGASDIAVLVFFRSEAEAVESELRERGIRYSFYKKTGIWQSDEAIQLHYVLNALAHSEDRGAFNAMLLTRCFTLNPGDAARLERPAAAQTDAISRLFTRWRELSQRRRWAELFRSILADTGTLNEELSGFGGARPVANFSYIADELARAAYQNGSGLLDIINDLQQKRLTAKLDEENLQPADSELPAVKLMTIHAAKGLEFPVVFLAGGFTHGPSDSYLKYHDDERRLVLNLEENDTNKARADGEASDEKRRLLYVAMTRARLKLYVPFVPTDGQPGWLSELLTPALTAALAANQFVDAPAQAAAPRLPAAPHPRPRKLSQQAASAKPMQFVSPLLPNLDVPALAARRLEIQSFSRLIHTPGVASHTAEPPRPPHGDDDEPKQYLEDDLPPGASAGEALHDILESIDFAAVKSAQAYDELLRPGSSSNDLIEQSIRRNLPLLNESDKAGRTRLLRRTAEIVWNTLRTPIPALGDSPLCSLADADRMHELEFHMPIGPGQPVIEELKTDRGFMTGWMDLVFRHANKFYLLDWKSNALAAYAREDLARDMTARRYDLQYRIYMEALRRWLGRVHKNFDEAKHVGGVFYIYMRGMRPSDPSRSSTGIFFVPKAKG